MTVVRDGARAAGRREERSPRPVIRRNDYSVLEPVPPLGGWDPVLGVSVVVPAFGGQEKLDLTLASLAAQSYPAALTEVVVVDDGSDPPLVLPPIRPENTRLIPAAPGGWGPGHAVQCGVDASDGAVVLRLDSDVVVSREHVEAQMRWHHLADHLAVTGHLRCVDHTAGALSPSRVHDAVDRGAPETLVEGPGGELAWLRRGYDRTDGLRSAGPTAYSRFIGATGSVRRELFEACGGAASALVLGEDTHLGYRLAQCGAVFVPELETSGWHLGRPQMESRSREGARFREPFVGNRLPLAAARRGSAARQWQVPFVDVVVEVAGATSEEVADTVERLLGGRVADLRITLVGDWSRVTAGRHGLLDDPALELRLVHEHFRCEPRVRFAERDPGPDRDVPFRLLLPPGLPLRTVAVRALTSAADRHAAGLVRVGPARGVPRMIRLERTAAFARARRRGTAVTERALDRAVAELWGSGGWTGRRWWTRAATVAERPPRTGTSGCAGRRGRRPRAERQRNCWNAASAS